jgi:hypothetical protein
MARQEARDLIYDSLALGIIHDLIYLPVDLTVNVRFDRSLFGLTYQA